jgi:hypothetical protein
VGMIIKIFEGYGTQSTKSERFGKVGKKVKIGMHLGVYNNVDIVLYCFIALYGMVLYALYCVVHKCVVNGILVEEDSARSTEMRYTKFEIDCPNIQVPFRGCSVFQYPLTSRWDLIRLDFFLLTIRICPEE